MFVYACRVGVGLFLAAVRSSNQWRLCFGAWSPGRH